MESGSVIVQFTTWQEPRCPVGQQEACASSTAAGELPHTHGLRSALTDLQCQWTGVQAGLGHLPTGSPQDSVQGTGQGSLVTPSWDGFAWDSVAILNLQPYATGADRQPHGSRKSSLTLLLKLATVSVGWGSLTNGLFILENTIFFFDMEMSYSREKPVIQNPFDKIIICFHVSPVFVVITIFRTDFKRGSNVMSEQENEIILAL